MKAFLLACVAVALTLIIFGCATPETRIIEDPQTNPELVFLQNDRVTREVILDRFGTPASEYEGGRIIIYWLKENDEGLLEVTTKTADVVAIRHWKNMSNKPTTGYYNLVLVFDAGDVLVKSSIVFIR